MYKPIVIFWWICFTAITFMHIWSWESNNLSFMVVYGPTTGKSIDCHMYTSIYLSVLKWIHNWEMYCSTTGPGFTNNIFKWFRYYSIQNLTRETPPSYRPENGLKQHNGYIYYQRFLDLWWCHDVVNEIKVSIILLRKIWQAKRKVSL